MTKPRGKKAKAWAIANEHDEVFAGTWWLEDQATTALRGFATVPSSIKWRVVPVLIILDKSK